MYEVQVNFLTFKHLLKGETKVLVFSHGTAGFSCVHCLVDFLQLRGNKPGALYCLQDQKALILFSINAWKCAVWIAVDIKVTFFFAFGLQLQRLCKDFQMQKSVPWVVGNPTLFWYIRTSVS